MPGDKAIEGFPCSGTNGVDDENGRARGKAIKVAPAGSPPRTAPSLPGVGAPPRIAGALDVKNERCGLSGRWAREYDARYKSGTAERRKVRADLLLSHPLDNPFNLGDCANESVSLSLWSRFRLLNLRHFFTFSDSSYTYDLVLWWRLHTARYCKGREGVT